MWLASSICRALGILLAVVTLMAADATAQAEKDFPAQTVRIIVPFPAGSALDGVTRLVAERLNQAWGGRGVVIENIAGAGGNLGTQQFARSMPDGHTLLAAPPGPFVLNPFLYKQVNYDPTTFVPLSLLATVPNVLVVRPDLEAVTFEDFLGSAMRSPGKLNYASQGVGSSGYLTGRALEQRAGISLIHVPYRGAAQILADLSAGHIDSFFDTATTSLPLHTGKKVRILAVADDVRLQSLPDVPAVAEFFPGFRSITWFALAAPAGTSKPLAEKISRDIAKVISSDEMRQRLAEQQMTGRGYSVDETASFLRTERDYWSKLISEINFERQ